jgi:hypothetical protein
MDGMALGGALLSAATDAFPSPSDVELGTRLVREGSSFLGLGLGASGVCFLGLWQLNLVAPTPRLGGLLLLISGTGGSTVLFGRSPEVPASMQLLVIVSAPVLLFVAMITLVAPRVDRE